MNDCIDPNSPEERNKVWLEQQKSLSSGTAITTSQGTYTLDAISQFTSEFENSIVSNETSDNVVNIAISNFGETDFYESVRGVNSFIFSDDLDLTDYDALRDRKNQGVIITPLEIAEFESEYNYTPTLLSNTLVVNKNKLLFELNFFYTASFSNSKIGSFCAIAPTIFGAVESFFDSLNDLKSFISRIQDISLVGVIKTLKDGILAVFGGIIQGIKGIVDNFSMSGIIGRSEAFINEAIIRRVTELKEAAQSFFSEANIKSIQDRLSALVEYTLGIFKNPSLEEIQYIVYRFCGLATQIGGAIKQVKKPLTDYSNNYTSVYQTLSTSSNRNTASAISAGAIRYQTETRRSNINSLRNDFTAAGNPPPLVIGEAEDVTPWNNGRGDSRVGFGPGLQVGSMGEEGWTRVDIKARVMLMRVQTRFGRKLQVNSGYRSPAYNAKLNGAARNSFHMQGKAIDVSWSGINTSNREEFIRIAREEGFRGIGRYGSRFVHVDIRSTPASWGS